MAVAYTPIADINATSYCRDIFSWPAVCLGVKAQIADINATSLCDNITPELLWGVKVQVADINATSSCPNVAATLSWGTKSLIADINATSYCGLVTVSIGSRDIFLSVDIDIPGESFITTPLIRISEKDIAGVARPRASGSEFRINLSSDSYTGKILEHMTIRYNFDDKRFVRGIYASKTSGG